MSWGKYGLLGETYIVTPADVKPVRSALRRYGHWVDDVPTGVAMADIYKAYALTPAQRAGMWREVCYLHAVLAPCCSDKQQGWVADANRAENYRLRIKNEA